MTTRREILARIKSSDASTANPSLWLDKFLGEPNTHKDDLKRKLIADVAAKADDQKSQSLYRKYFERWQKTINDYCSVPPRKAKVCGRMVIDLGAESVLETSISLHRTYGVPYIPGSALKGLARRCAAKVDGFTKEHIRELFGNEKNSNDALAGCITFFDSLWVPETGVKALHSDVLTVHHKEYYEGKQKPPADWDDPTPVPFLSATGTYLIALAGPLGWVEATFKLLEIALAEEGLGAKTSSGYGRMEFVSA
jgi:CRISPR-associated protein Cmr6